MIETAAQALSRLADATERLGPGPVLPPYVVPGRDVDGIGRQVPRNPFAGKAGVALLLRMGLASQFERRVPDEYVMGYAVRCCGENNVMALDVGEIAECVGGCGRYFLRTEQSIRVARWPRDETEGEGDGLVA